MSNFIQSYVYAAGRSETPRLFHRWSCLSLMAAALGNRVYATRMGDPIMPNLYVMLIGPSGCGKNRAIEEALRLAAQVPSLRDRTIRGKLTAPSLLDLLAGRTTQVDEKGKAKVGQVEPMPHPYIVYPELYMSLGSGPLAESFITTLTDLYGGSPVPIKERTRQWGMATIENPCISFQAGTTREWLSKAIKPDAISGGFFGRVIALEAGYAEERIANPSRPDDYAQVFDYLAARLQAITLLEGECRMTGDALDNWTTWYETRPLPEDETLRPAFQRDGEIVLKVATLFSVADGDDLLIKNHHMSWAQKWVAEARSVMPNLVAMSYMTAKSQMLGLLANYIDRVGRATRTQISRYMTSKGVTTKELDELLTTLINNGQVEGIKVGTGRVYVWVRRKRYYVDPSPLEENTNEPIIDGSTNP